MELVNDSLYEWHVRLYAIDPESNLAKDMQKFQIPYILLHLDFPNNFPFSPPFMRVVEPHIKKGYVMKGGAICMELLTPRGWASAYTIEAILIQFSASVVKGEGRIDHKDAKKFSKLVETSKIRHCRLLLSFIITHHDISLNFLLARK